MMKRGDKRRRKLKKMRKTVKKEGNSFVHLLYTPFTGLGLNRNRMDDKWLAYRIDVFKQHTLKSLLNQTNRNFTHWISFREVDRERQLVKDFQEYMHAIPNYKTVFTFGGIAFWDDKYEKDNLLERLQNTLPDLIGACYKKDYVLKTIQPSDDMYSGKAVDEFQKHKTSAYEKGYMLNKETQRLAEYNPATSPPFYTIMFPRDVFLNPEKHMEYMGGFKSHEDIPKIFDTTKLKGRKFCVVVHGKNISTNWEHPFRGRVLDWDEGAEILKDFGIKVDTPSDFVGGLREFKLSVRRTILQILIKIGLYKYGWKIRQIFKVRLSHKTGE